MPRKLPNSLLSLNSFPISPFTLQQAAANLLISKLNAPPFSRNSMYLEIKQHQQKKQTVATRYPHCRKIHPSKYEQLEDGTSLKLIFPCSRTYVCQLIFLLSTVNFKLQAVAENGGVSTRIFGRKNAIVTPP